MTTLYKPVLIESAEQAEALPLGTPVWNLRPHDFVDDRGYVDAASGQRMVDTVTGRHFAADMIGWTALVPIEVEEEHQLTFHGDPFGLPMDEADARTVIAGNKHKGAGMATRYVSPWEETR